METAKSTTGQTVRRLAALLFLAATGCDEYRISMRAEGDRIERTVSLWSGGESGSPKEFDAAKSARLAGLYGESGAGAAHSFSDLFSKRLPEDVGGFGSFEHLDSDLGSLSVYLERFRGTNDLASSLEATEGRIDLFVELLGTFVEREMGPGPEAERLAAFVRERLGPDLRNLELYRLSAHLTRSPEEMGLRALQYLIERGYLELEDLPELGRLFRDESESEVVPRVIGRILGVPLDAPLPDELASFLADGDRLESAFEAHARRHPRFQEWLASRRASAAPTSDEHAVRKWFKEEVSPLGSNFLELGGDWLRVTLQTGAKPFATNGSWNEATGELAWLGQELRSASNPGAFLYAAWSEPDEAAQTARFGRVVLTGRALGDYVYWRRGLVERDAREWDAFVSMLAPRPDLRATLLSFHFSDEQRSPDAPADTPPAGRAAEILRLLVAALEPEA